MAEGVWKECVDEINAIFVNSPNKELPDIDWSSVAQSNLDNDTFSKGVPFNIICPNRHCDIDVSITPVAHALCQCLDINNNPIPNCKPASYLFPYPGKICVNIKTNEYNGLMGRTCERQGDGVSWYNLTCYCCCACFAYGTKIAVPGGGLMAVQGFNLGDRVLTGDVQVAKELQFDWKSAKIGFSFGTGPGSKQSAMIHVNHSNNASLIVTPDHLFLLPAGKLKRADRLVPGKDKLVSAQGESVEINEVSVGEWDGGVHHIATDIDFDIKAENPLNGHLLISEGVVTGDFNLQIHSELLKEANFFEADHDDLPKVGTKEYEAQNTSLKVGTFNRSLIADTAASTDTTAPTTDAPTAKSPQLQKFYVHGENTVGIPDAAVSYISPEQEELLANVDKYSTAEINLINVSVNYVLRLFQGFYPDILFFHDVGRLESNAYAFSQYGKQFIVLSGGLTRIKGLQMEGLSLILSHLVARLQKLQPLEQNGYTSVAMADYYSTVTLRNVYFVNLYSDIYKPGFKQIEDFIFSKLNNTKYEEDPFAPDTELRLDSIDAGNNMGFPPPGISGPTLNGLQVLSAEAHPIRLTADSFASEDVDATAATQVFSDLQQNSVISESGEVSPDFSMDTDLSFLFKDQTGNTQQHLTAGVRTVMLRTGAEILLTFNMPVNTDSAKDLADYTLNPEAKISSVSIKDNQPEVVRLTTKLQKRLEYTITVDKFIRAGNGSTLDPEKNSATFTLSSV